MAQVTTVILPPALKAAVQAEAKDKGVSMAAVIRWALQERYERRGRLSNGGGVDRPGPQEVK